MISDKNLIIVRSLVHILNKFKVVPLKWNEKSKSYSHEKECVPFCYLHALIAAIQLCLCANFLRNGLFSDQLYKLSALELSTCSLTFTYMLLILTFEVVLLLDPESVPAFHNALEKFIHRMKRKRHSLKYVPISIG